MLEQLANEIADELEAHDQAGGFQRAAGNPPRNMVVASQPRGSIIATIVAYLPILAQVASTCAATGQAAQDESPQEMIGDNYDEASGNYDRHLVERLRPQAKRANRQANKKLGVQPDRLSPSEADAITIKALDKARLATPEQFEAGWKEATTGVVPADTITNDQTTDTNFNVSGSEKESQSIGTSEIGNLSEVLGSTTSTTTQPPHFPTSTSTPAPVNPPISTTTPPPSGL